MRRSTVNAARTTSIFFAQSSSALRHENLIYKKAPLCPKHSGAYFQKLLPFQPQFSTGW